MEDSTPGHGIIACCRFTALCIDGLSELAMEDEETGEEKVELDALESLHPGELEEIVTENIERFRDANLVRKYQEARQHAEEALKNTLQEELREELETLKEIKEEARPILERYQDLLEKLAERMGRELEPLRMKLEATRQNH
jgi:hypothetical protein